MQTLNNPTSFKNKVMVLMLYLMILMLCSCVSNSENLARRKTEQLLNVELSAQVEDILIEEILANSALRRPNTAVTTYFRARMSEDEYFDLIEHLNMVVRVNSVENEYTIFLLTQLYPKEFTPDWWMPDPIPNEYSSAGKLQSTRTQSWIISTYDGEYAYFKSYEEGTSD